MEINVYRKNIKLIYESLENVSRSDYLIKTLRKRNDIYFEITRRIHFGNTHCCVGKPLSIHLFSMTFERRLYETKYC
jgi:hypothetical protein